MKVIQFCVFLLCTLTSSLTFAQLKVVCEGKIETFNLSSESQVESIGKKCQIFKSEDGTSLSLVSSIYGFGESALLKNASSTTSGRLILNDRGDYDFLPKRDTRNVNSLKPGCSVDSRAAPPCTSFVEHCEPCTEESRLDLVIIVTQEFIPYIEGRGWNVEDYLNAVLAELALTFSNLGIDGMLNASIVYADFPMSDEALSDPIKAKNWAQLDQWSQDGLINDVYDIVHFKGYDRALVLTPVFATTPDDLLAEGYASSCEVPTRDDFSAVVGGDAITQGLYLTSHELGHILGARHGFNPDADNDDDGCPGGDRYFDPGCNSEPDCPVYQESIMTGSNIPNPYDQYPDWAVIPEFSKGEEYGNRNNAGTIASEWCNVSNFNNLQSGAGVVNNVEINLIDEPGCGWLINFEYACDNTIDFNIVQHQASSQPPVVTSDNVVDFECNDDNDDNEYSLQIDSDGNCTPQALTFSAVISDQGETFSFDLTIALPSLDCDDCVISGTPIFIPEDPEDCETDIRVYSTPVPQGYYTEIYIKYAGSSDWDIIPEGFLIVTDCSFSVKVVTKDNTSQMEVSFTEVTGLHVSDFRNKKKCFRRVCHEPQNDDAVFYRVGGKLNDQEVISFTSNDRSIVANLNSYNLEDDDFVLVSDILGREVFKGAFSQILPDQFLYSSGKILFVKILKK